ncbi:Nlpc/p60 superfamily protein, partial [Monkeypox virus]
LSQNFTDDN